ncbi:acyltransferase [Leptospira santarosai]|uniref:acyltransferase n=1 Tax=Leptospira santarosai TaxID=28183 RepID=UPI0002BF8E8F|nr:acyltransferase [Leptospira santarosai]EMP82339.1 acyl transferase [Leptospira santarosai str. CBC1531]
METKDFHIKTSDGRDLVIWKDSPEKISRHPVLICGGFSTRMSVLSPIVSYILKNQANAYRIDYLDHVGLSDGEIKDFGLNSMNISIDSALSLIQELEPDQNISILAISLGAVGAILSSANNPRIASIGCMVGVMDVRKTLHRVFKEDYYAWDFSSLPEVVDFDGFDIDPRPLWKEHSELKNADISYIKNALSVIRAPIFNIVASEDKWLDLSEVKDAFSAPGEGLREIIEIPYAGHELARNPIALRLSLRELISRIFYQGKIDAVTEPSFDEIADLKILDRRRSKASMIKT